MPKIYTIGYCDQRFEDFVEVLRRFDIELVVDVRRFPTSKWPEFVKEELQKALSAQGIDYIHLRELGGYRGGYEAYTKTKRFDRALKELMELARRKSTVVMCVERNPSACHRRFIARILEQHKWEIVHL